MEQAIKRAKTGGYDVIAKAPSYNIYSEMYLDPLFWQALGKAEGWGQKHDMEYDDDGITPIPDWQYNWHRYIDHLIEGRDPEEFWKELLDKK